MITVIGTHKNIPGIPHSVPHRPKDNKMTIGLKLSLCPIKRGSSTLPMQNCKVVNTEMVITKGATVSNWMSVNTEGKRVAMIEPMVGMKFSKKIKTAQKLAKSTPTKESTK